MNVFLWGACALVLAILPCLIAMLRGDVMSRMVALQMATLHALLALLLMAEGFHRSIYFDVPLTLAVLSYASGQTYLRWMERWV